jgi:hypothetical protein
MMLLSASANCARETFLGKIFLGFTQKIFADSAARSKLPIHLHLHRIGRGAVTVVGSDGRTVETDIKPPRLVPEHLRGEPDLRIFINPLPPEL